MGGSGPEAIEVKGAIVHGLLDDASVIGGGSLGGRLYVFGLIEWVRDGIQCKKLFLRLIKIIELLTALASLTPPPVVVVC